MKLFNVYKSGGTARWTMPIKKGNKSIYYLYGMTLVGLETESELDSFDDHSEIDLSLLNDHDAHRIVKLLFTELNDYGEWK